MTEDITLPSGKTLKITLAPFADAKALYQACLEEIRTLRLDPAAEIDVNLFKDLFCLGFSSKKVDACLTACLKRVLYDNRRITDETFEDVSAREDYPFVLLEVAQANLRPFVRHLSSRYSTLLQSLKSGLTPSSGTKPS